MTNASSNPNAAPFRGNADIAATGLPDVPQAAAFLVKRVAPGARPID
jgi:hypothetical protein